LDNEKLSKRFLFLGGWEMAETEYAIGKNRIIEEE